MGTFHPATKRKAKLRCAIFGPSGSGKTFSALRIAKGMGGRVAVIDTEFGSASKYADRFTFDTAELTEPTIENYRRLICEASQQYDILIIDSLSHGWQELLQEVDNLALSKYRGNTWSAWSEGTPRQRALVKTIQAAPCHIIATMRSKTEWTTATDGKRSRPVRVGLAPEQGKGIEYEFDLLLELSPEHVCHVIKDRTGKFQDQTIEKPGEAFGGELMAWLNEGAEPQPAPQQPSASPTQPAPQPRPAQQPQQARQSRPDYPQPGQAFSRGRRQAGDDAGLSDDDWGRVIPQGADMPNPAQKQCLVEAWKRLSDLDRRVSLSAVCAHVWARWAAWPQTQWHVNKILDPSNTNIEDLIRAEVA